jgi:hypothetical protein
MTSDEILRHRVNSFLLPPPGGEAVRFILDELYRHGDERAKEERERIVDHLTWLAGTYHDTRDKDAADALSDAAYRIERGDHLTPPTGGEG